MSPGLQSQTALLYNYSVCHQGRILCLRYNQGGGSKTTMNNHTIVGLHNLIPISNFYQFVSRNAFMNTGMKMIILHHNILQIERFLKRRREKNLINALAKCKPFGVLPQLSQRPGFSVPLGYWEVSRSKHVTNRRPD